MFPVRDLQRAAQISGRPALALLREAVQLRRGIGRLGLSEYIGFRLFLDDLSFAQKACFGGWRADAALEEILVDDYARFLSLDKTTMYAVLQGYGLPVPTLRAIYGARRPASVPSLGTPRELQAFLRAEGHLPAYLKPSFGVGGRGHIHLTGRDGDDLLRADGSTLPVSALADTLGDGRGLGWLIQQPLAPHPAIAEHCGPGLSSVRVHTFLTPQGPQILRAVLRIHAGGDTADNFRGGTSGNLAGAVDRDSGRVTRVVSGTGFAQCTDPPHPLTGATLTGLQLPDWPAVRELVCEAHTAFPGYIGPGWDIALCPDGPRILEVNFTGNIHMPQQAARRGFLDEELLELMARRGLAGLLGSARGARERSPQTGRIGRRKQHWAW